MFKWLRRREGSTFSPTSISHPGHYKTTARTAQGGPDELTLAETDVTGPFVTLVYAWASELCDAEADRLDSRVRAFVACAIHDAAKAAGVASASGPAYGQRPSWILGESRMPVSVVDAGFDTDQKVCYVKVGPVMTAGGALDTHDPHAQRLLSGFQLRFSRILV